VRGRALLLAIALSSPAPASAQEAQDPGAAEALFQKARPLMEKGKLDEACPLFEESYRLDPAPGTLLNLAACSRLTGKTATSWSQFIEAGRSFRRKGDERRAQFADAQAKELEPLLAYVVIRADSAPQGLILKRDDTELTASVLDTKLPLDPGEHVITANAPGHKTGIVKFTAEARKTIDVVIPKLEVGEPDPPPVGEGAPRGDTLSGDDGERASRRRAQHIAAFVVGGVGAASLAVGGVFVGLTAMKSGDTEELCPNKRCTTQAGRDALSEANTFANVANGTLIAGGVLLATGIVVYLTAPSAAVDVALAPAPGGVSLVGRF
jgi:hypothetical protein